MSPDGRWLASAGRDRQVKVWDTQSWSEVSRLPESDVPIATIAFTADSTQLVAMRTSRETTWWNLIEQHVDRVTTGDGPPTRFAAISPDLQWIAASHRHLPSETMLFDASTGELRRHIRSLRRPIRVHKFSPDSSVLARGDSSGCLEVWDLHNNQPALNLSAHQEAVNDIVFSPSGNLLASASQRGSIKVWKTRIAQSQQIHKMNDSVRQLIVLKDDTVAVLDNTGRLDVLSPGGSTPVSWSTSRPSKILAFTMTQNAKTLFCRGDRIVSKNTE